MHFCPSTSSMISRMSTFDSGDSAMPNACAPSARSCARGITRSGSSWRVTPFGSWEVETAIVTAWRDLSERMITINAGGYFTPGSSASSKRKLGLESSSKSGVRPTPEESDSTMKPLLLISPVSLESSSGSRSTNTARLSDTLRAPEGQRSFEIRSMSSGPLGGLRVDDAALVQLQQVLVERLHLHVVVRLFHQGEQLVSLRGIPNRLLDRAGGEQHLHRRDEHRAILLGNQTQGDDRL